MRGFSGIREQIFRRRPFCKPGLDVWSLSFRIPYVYSFYVSVDWWVRSGSRVYPPFWALRRSASAFLMTFSLVRCFRRTFNDLTLLDRRCNCNDDDNQQGSTENPRESKEPVAPARYCTSRYETVEGWRHMLRGTAEYLLSLCRLDVYDLDVRNRRGFRN